MLNGSMKLSDNVMLFTHKLITCRLPVFAKLSDFCLRQIRQLSHFFFFCYFVHGDVFELPTSTLFSRSQFIFPLVYLLPH